MPGANNNQSGVITSEMSGGGLKITYEKQIPSNSTLQVDLERITPIPEVPAKRLRSESTEKEKPRRKRGSHTLGTSLATNSTMTTKRASRSQSNLDLTAQHAASSFSGLSQSTIKESPPSSPSSESLGSAPSNGRKKGRKSAPASVCSTANPKDSKDNVKVFQNGIHAPHMLGNQLNPNSNMAQKMSDHLNSELEAHSIFTPNEASCNLVGPPLQHRVIASVRSNSTGGSSTASGGSGLSSMLGGNSGALPQTLEQLLERHWEQGSQFLMEQAQHFDSKNIINEFSFTTSSIHRIRVYRVVQFLIGKRY
nr:uncharacterized protein LOC111422617 [Onthophagus taurus]